MPFRFHLSAISLSVTGLIFVMHALASDTLTDHIPAPIASGGKTSTNHADSNAFSLPASNLSFKERLTFSTGNSFFRNPWIPAPSSTTARDGLGPLFNTNGCQNCHIKDGRGHPANTDANNAVSMLVRISIPARTKEQLEAVKRQGVIPEPTYGGQIQDQSIPGVPPEARVRMRYSYHPVMLNGNENAELRTPTLEVDQLQYGAMDPDTRFSVRIAQPMIGLGLLESIPAKEILAGQDPEDSNNDNIRGIANRVWDVRSQQFTLGRFGWKAGQPNLMQQNAAAFNGDLGITSSLFVNDHCTPTQKLCSNAESGGQYEVSDNILSMVEFYTQHLAVPRRRNADNLDVREGDRLFSIAGCDSCHRRSFITSERPDRPALSKQKIAPYTDLLLHDMGEGLADNRSEFLANGQQWRTAPLWGLGLTETVSGHTQLLHDGRARSVLEAILWHGGEAQNARDYVINMAPEQRASLLAFLDSL